MAVLPFLSDSPGNNYLGDGLTEATVNGLVQLQALRVAPRTNALRYKGSAVRPKDAGRELDVAAVVTGSVTQQDGRLRIQVDLVDVARDSQIWGAVYQGDASELVHLQTRILQDLTRAGIPLSDQESQGSPAAHGKRGCVSAYRAAMNGAEIGSRVETRDRRFNRPSSSIPSSRPPIRAWRTPIRS